MSNQGTKTVSLTSVYTDSSMYTDISHQQRQGLKITVNAYTAYTAGQMDLPQKNLV